MKEIILWIVGIGIVLAGVYHLLHAFFVDRHMIRTQATFTSPKVPKSLEGYKIAFVTDLHNISTHELMNVVEDINRQQVDLLLLGGDFEEDEALALHDIMLLSQVQTEDGIYGVQGNHDFKNRLFRHLREYGMKPLSNQGVEVRPGLYLGGTEDYRLGNPNIPRALAGAQPGDLKLLLTHNPDSTMLRGGEHADLVLAGHTHGGEVSAFGVFPPWVAITSHHGFRFSGGWTMSSYQVPVYVSRGMGKHFLFRVFVPSEMVYLTLSTGETQSVDATHQRMSRPSDQK